MSEHHAIPRFMEAGKLQFSIDTSGYCQARCALCVWPELKSAKRIMSAGEFATVLERFEGYAFSEFAFNSINEPFVDKTVVDKIEMLVDSGLSVDSLFFSSNWLMPDDALLERMANALAKAVAAPSIGSVNLNATISGIDDESYDILQAGRRLEGVQMPYKKLDFGKAVGNVALLCTLLAERLPSDARLVFRLKAYGHEFDQEQYRSFWRNALAERGVPQRFIDRHTKPILNHALTTFARAGDDPDAPAEAPRMCSMRWLDDLLVVGSAGQIGLCCQEGAHKIKLSSLLDATLEEIVASPGYQEQLAITRGERRPGAAHPCASCEHYVVKAPAARTTESALAVGS